jgi:peptidoglycan/LPS O-acetylase OafA/YrhL
MAHGGAEQVTQAGEVRSARVESLRALAALAVLGAHVFGQAHAYDPAQTLATLGDRILLGGGFGVFLFFVLSGYLLYLPFARRDLGGGPAVDLRRYARNRVVRILPLYYVVLAAVLVVGEGGGTARQWLTFGTFTQNLTTDRHALTDVNGVMWSLATEVHFYVLLPLLAAAIAWVARHSLRRAALVLAVLGLASFVLRYLTFYREARLEEPLLDFSLASTFMFFAAGMLVAVARVGRSRPLSGPLGASDAWVAASAVLWLLVAEDYTHGWLAAPASALLVGACVLPLRPGVALRALAWPPLAAVGVVSYSLYLWHLPIVESFEPGAWVLAAVPLALAPAFVSYRLVEEPFLRLRRAWGATAARHAEEPPPTAAAPARRATASELRPSP